jgi:hypothetical protein
MSQSVTPINSNLIDALAQIILSLTDEERQLLEQRIQAPTTESELQQQREMLRHDLAIGIEQLKRGEYQEYDDASLPHLLTTIKSRGQAGRLHRNC